MPGALIRQCNFRRAAYNRFMRTLAVSLLSISALTAAPLFQAAFDANSKQWEAVRGTATPDQAVQHAKHTSMRVEPSGESDAYVHSTPVSLTVGKRYELSGWLRTENLAVRDLDRSPIATGASLAMASMPFDVHSESLGGTRPWTRVSLRFTATRPGDRRVLGVAGGPGEARSQVRHGSRASHWRKSRSRPGCRKRPRSALSDPRTAIRAPAGFTCTSRDSRMSAAISMAT